MSGGRPFAIVCDHSRSFATVCDHLRSFANVCDGFRPFAIVCDHLRSFATICDHFRRFATFCDNLRSFVTVREHLRSFFLLSLLHCHFIHLTILRRLSWPSLAYMCTRVVYNPIHFIFIYKIGRERPVIWLLSGWITSWIAYLQQRKLLVQCLSNAGPSSATMGQHWTNIGQTLFPDQLPHVNGPTTLTAVDPAALYWSWPLTATKIIAFHNGRPLTPLQKNVKRGIFYVQTKWA